MKVTAPQYHHAIAASRTLTEAARRLGVSRAAVSQWRRRIGLPPRRRGRPAAAELVCPIRDGPQRVCGSDFDRLYRELGASQTAWLLNITLAAVSSRALRRGLRERRGPCPACA